MAKKKLLCFVTLLLLCCFSARANEGFHLKKADIEKDDMEFTKDLTERSRQMTLVEMKAKWLELQNMLGNKEENINQSSDSLVDFEREFQPGASFRIFVSHSMSMNLLKSYGRLAKKYGAILVFNGLPGGSWNKLYELVTEISGSEPELIGIQIDDEAFARFNVKEVPSFVLSKEEDIFAEHPRVTFDKVTGSIGIRKALEIFAGAGQLKDIASSKLAEVPKDE